jgi:hypothetical protein
MYAVHLLASKLKHHFLLLGGCCCFRCCRCVSNYIWADMARYLALHKDG